MNIRKVLALFASSAVLVGSVAATTATPASAASFSCSNICRFVFGQPPSAVPGVNEVGLQFQSSQQGYIAAICFWQASAEASGSHTVSLWDSSGTLLGTAAGLTRSGAENCVSMNPVAIDADTLYTASYTTKSDYDIWRGQFQIARAFGPLSAPVNAGAIGEPGAAPTSGNRDGYGVDVGFLTSIDQLTTDCPSTLTAPTKLSSAPGNPGSAVVSWAPATSVPEGCIVGYIVTPYLDGELQPSTLIPGNGTTTVIKGLTLGASYTFTVAAESGRVVGPQSEETGPITIGTPAAPTALAVARASKGTVKVAFKASRKNGAQIRNYTATCKSPAGATRAKSGKSGPLRVSHLSPGKKYTCRVHASNRYGNGPSSAKSKSVKA